MSLPFLKMQALGNDFIVVDDLGKSSALFKSLTDERAKKICDRRLGIGADQILWLRSDETQNYPADEKNDHKNHEIDCEMLILNADGSRAETCGNGLRAVGLYLHRHGPVPWRTEYRVRTAAGLNILKIGSGEVTVDMGVPKVSGELERVEVSGLKALGLDPDSCSYSFRRIDVGNPHAVIFVPDVSKIALDAVGPKIEHHSLFPKRTNVEFVEIVSRTHIRIRVWERGAGATLACGSGACAAAIAAIFDRKVDSSLTVSLPGGDLKLSWDGKSGSSVFQTGPASEMFRGELVFD